MNTKFNPYLSVQKYEETRTECRVYRTIIEDIRYVGFSIRPAFWDDVTNGEIFTIRQFLASVPDINRKYLPVPDAFVCHNDADNEDNSSDFFVLEDVKNLGFRQDILHPDRGQGSDLGDRSQDLLLVKIFKTECNIKMITSAMIPF